MSRQKKRTRLVQNKIWFFKIDQKQKWNITLTKNNRNHFTLYGNAETRTQSTVSQTLTIQHTLMCIRESQIIGRSLLAWDWDSLRLVSVWVRNEYEILDKTNEWMAKTKLECTFKTGNSGRGSVATQYATHEARCVCERQTHYSCNDFIKTLKQQPSIFYRLVLNR